MSEDSVTEDTKTASPKFWLAIVGLALILAGGFLAHAIRTSGGTAVSDVRFEGAEGVQMSALLYVPAGATAETPAPGILAVHGYINSREMQDGFAIEFARRGYVVLSIDQTGHGYSDGPAFSNGFGGPDGLRYLRSLPMVNPDQIGLEGHSMGGWTILAAADAMPDAYRSMVLQGSSTGAPFAPEGSPGWPRNLALVFSQYDEFSQIMWETDRALDAADSTKLQAVFGTDKRVVSGQVYGDIEAGTARVLHQPATTHPGNHISSTSIGHAVDWFAETLEGGDDLPASDQIWMWKEIGTGIGLIGFVMLLLGAFDALVRLPFFAVLRASPVAAIEQRDRRWWRSFAINAAIPATLFYPAFIAAFFLLPASAFLPQAVTTQVTLWALATASVGLLLARFSLPSLPQQSTDWLRSIALAAATIAAGYAALLLVDQLFQTDFRFWVVAVKLPGPQHWLPVAIYLIPITLAFMVTLRAITGSLSVRGDTALKRYAAAILTLTAGFIALLVLIYGIFFATGTLITAFDPLSTVIALQFVPILTAIGIITIFTWHRTNSHRPGALIVGMLVTLYVVSGTATQV